MLTDPKSLLKTHCDLFFQQPMILLGTQKVCFTAILWQVLPGSPIAINPSTRVSPDVLWLHVVMRRDKWFRMCFCHFVTCSSKWKHTILKSSESKQSLSNSRADQLAHTRQSAKSSYAAVGRPVLLQRDPTFALVSSAVLLHCPQLWKLSWPTVYISLWHGLQGPPKTLKEDRVPSWTFTLRALPSPSDPGTAPPSSIFASCITWLPGIITRNKYSEEHTNLGLFR